MPVTLAPFPLAELAEWMSVQRVSYVADRMRAGDDEAAAGRVRSSCVCHGILLSRPRSSAGPAGAVHRRG